MSRKAEGSNVEFIIKRCHIHGRFGDKIYRRKRNGKLWVYDYVYKPHYAHTVLSKRFVYITRVLAKLTNPQQSGFKVLCHKFFYYTPYFVYPGKYSFTCRDFFKIVRSGNYTITINDVSLDMHLAKRKKFILQCEAGKNYEIKCYSGDRLYSRRVVQVISAERELEQVYEEWYAAHLRDILESEDPRFQCLKRYRRGIEPPLWLNSIWGKTESGIIYRSHKVSCFMYSRQPYLHVANATTDHFYLSIKRITGCWTESSQDLKRVLHKYWDCWFERNYRQIDKIVLVHNLWSKLVFRAGKALGFDLEKISQENWLPGVENLDDLIKIAGFSRCGIDKEELKVNIF